MIKNIRKWWRLRCARRDFLAQIKEQLAKLGEGYQRDVSSFKNAVLRGKGEDFLQLRDKWFIFFGANPQFKAKETAQTAYTIYAKGHGIIFEVKPSAYVFMEWKEIALGGKHDAIPAAFEGKLTYDIITRKKIPIQYVLSMQCPEDLVGEVTNIIRNHNRNITVLPFSQTHGRVESILHQVQEIIASYGLV